MFKLQRKAGNDTEFSAVPDYYDDSKTPFYHNVTDRVYNNGTITNKLVGTTKIHVKKLWDSINKTLLKYNDYPIADIFLYANIKSNQSNYTSNKTIYAKGKDFDHGGYAIVEGAANTSEALGELVNMHQINVSQADVTAGKTEFDFTTVRPVKKDSNGIVYEGQNSDHVKFGEETTLPKYDDNGALIKYSIKERAINGYTYRISGDEIINEYVGGDRVQIKVTKNWRNMTDASQYPTVKLTLHQCYYSIAPKTPNTMYEYQAFTETIRATDSTPVTYIFGTDDKKPLHKYAPTGKEFFYYVSEELIDALGQGKKVFSHYDVDPVTKVVTANNNSELSGLGFVCTITDVSDDSFKPNAGGIITVPVSEANNGTLTLNVNNLPSGDYTVSEVTPSGESVGTIPCTPATTATLTVTKTIDENTPENIYFQIYESNDPNTPISVPNSGDFIQIESTKMIVIPKADVTNNNVVLKLNDMYSGDYTVSEFDVEGNPVQSSNIAISKTDTVSLTITKTIPTPAENETAPTNIQFKILNGTTLVTQTADEQTLTAFKPDEENEIPVHERADVENNYSPSKENFQSLITINKNWQRHDGDNENPLNKEFEGISNYSFDLKRHTKTIGEKSIFRIDTGTNADEIPTMTISAAVTILSTENI